MVSQLQRCCQDNLHWHVVDDRLVEKFSIFWVWLQVNLCIRHIWMWMIVQIWKTCKLEIRTDLHISFVLGLLKSDHVALFIPANTAQFLQLAHLDPMSTSLSEIAVELIACARLVTVLSDIPAIMSTHLSDQGWIRALSIGRSCPPISATTPGLEVVSINKLLKT